MDKKSSQKRREYTESEYTEEWLNLKFTIWAFSSFEAQITGPRAYQVWTTLMYGYLKNLK